MNAEIASEITRSRNHTARTGAPRGAGLPAEPFPFDDASEYPSDDMPEPILLRNAFTGGIDLAVRPSESPHDLYPVTGCKTTLSCGKALSPVPISLILITACTIRYWAGDAPGLASGLQYRDRGFVPMLKRVFILIFLFAVTLTVSAQWAANQEEQGSSGLQCCSSP